jgi:hypothetical protein
MGTMTNDPLEETAQQIAAHGREALIARLRPAFEDAASSHADVLALSDEQIEQMVQRAADRADGLQWRRALASVASEELGIGLGEALGHPAVARAQAIVGAPSYEESLASLGTVAPQRSAPPPAASEAEPAPEPPAAVEQPAPLAEDELELEPPAEEPAPLAEDERETLAAEQADQDEHEDHEQREPQEHKEHEAPGNAAPEAPAVQTEAGVLKIAAMHVGGIANLEPEEEGLELRLSDVGLDIARGDNELVGRLTWREIQSLDVASPRGMRRRRRRDAQLVVRTAVGQATFQVPALTSDELRDHLQPMIARNLKA